MRIAEYCDVLKLLRDRPATANELAQMFEIKPSRAREWLQELAAQGLVDEVGEDTARGAPGRRSVLYVLASQWRGVGR